MWVLFLVSEGENNGKEDQWRANPNDSQSPPKRADEEDEPYDHEQGAESHTSVQGNTNRLMAQ